MKRSNNTRFVAQGGDVVAIVTHLMANQAPQERLGIHINVPGTVLTDVLIAIGGGAPPPAGLSEDELRASQQVKDFSTQRSGYSLAMRTRPQIVVRPGGFTGRARLLDPGP